MRLWGQLSAPGADEAASLWRILGLSERCRVLDAGCGDGRVALPLARLGGSGQRSASIRVYTITELVRLIEDAGLRFRAALHPGSGAPFSPAGPSLGGRVLLVAERTESGGSLPAPGS